MTTGTASELVVRDRLFVGGQWVEPASGETIDVVVTERGIAVADRHEDLRKELARRRLPVKSRKARAVAVSPLSSKKPGVTPSVFASFTVSGPDCAGAFSGAAGPVAGLDSQQQPPPPEVLNEQLFPVGQRHTTYLAGPEWMFRYREFIGQVNALYEVTGRHQGYELRAAVSAPGPSLPDGPRLHERPLHVPRLGAATAGWRAGVAAAAARGAERGRTDPVAAGLHPPGRRSPTSC